MTPASRRPWLIWAWIAGAAIICLLVTVRTFSDPDVWWHLELGHYILAHGVPQVEPFTFTPPAQPWVGQQWLYEVLLARLTDLSPVVASVAMGLAGTVAFVIAARSLPRSTAVPGAWLAISLLINVFAGGQVLGTRGQVITVLGIAVVMWVITRWREGDLRPLWLLPPLMVVWANMHSGAVIGVAMLLVAAALPRSERWGIAASRRPLLLATLAAAAATIINPSGPHLYAYVASTFGNGAITQLINEWQSPDFHNFWLRLLELDAIALVVAWTLAPGGPDYIDVLFAGAAFTATLDAQRNMAIFCVVATPQLARYGYAAWEGHRGRVVGGWRLHPLPGKPATIAAAALLVICAVGVAGSLAAPMRDLADGRQEATGEPQAAATYVLTQFPRQRIYSTYELGGYLVYRMPDDRVVYIYGESAIFGSNQLERYLDIHDLRPNWTSRLAELGAYHAILPAQGQEVAAFYEIGWRVDCHDVANDSVVMSRGAVLTPAVVPQPDPRTAPPC